MKAGWACDDKALTRDLAGKAFHWTSNLVYLTNKLHYSCDIFFQYNPYEPEHHHSRKFRCRIALYDRGYHEDPIRGSIWSQFRRYIVELLFDQHSEGSARNKCIEWRRYPSAI